MAYLNEMDDKLGQLAMQYRGTKDETIRKEIIIKYTKIVEQLIASGNWNEVLSPEDQLPRDVMPERFFEHWKSRQEI